MWFANLRGAIALILTLGIPVSPDASPHKRNVMVNLSYMIVLVTNLCIGATTKHVAVALRIPSATDIEIAEAVELEAELPTRDRRRRRSVEQQQQQPGERTALLRRRRPARALLHRWWILLDEAHMKPIFGGQPRSEKVLRECGLLPPLQHEEGEVDEEEEEVQDAANAATV
eukprot:TRINITY_DN2573_c0_g1_i1.p3 TRINITY_DN2573_c0_g1~~TRINITY_DN2573_c0_g1_i1.p3  ORF type:complete len:172 (-),score=63.68 TRINITY_DN2573_c0_g1_i1:31-546(-)